MSGEQTIHLERYSGPAKYAIAAAQTLADQSNHAQVTPDHILVILLERDYGKKAFERSHFDAAVILKSARERLDALNKTPGSLSYLSSQTLKLLMEAEERQKKEKRKNVDVECLFFALTRLDFLSQEIFATPWPESEWGNALPDPPKVIPTSKAVALANASKPLKDLVDNVWAALASPEERLAAHAAATIAQVRRTLSYPTPPPRLVVENVSDLELKLECEGGDTPIVLEYTRSGLVLEYGDQSVTFEWHDDAMTWRSPMGAELFATVEAFLVRFYPELTAS